MKAPQRQTSLCCKPWSLSLCQALSLNFSEWPLLSSVFSIWRRAHFDVHVFSTRGFVRSVARKKNNEDPERSRIRTQHLRRSIPNRSRSGEGLRAQITGVHRRVLRCAPSVVNSLHCLTSRAAIGTECCFGATDCREPAGLPCLRHAFSGRQRVGSSMAGECRQDGAYKQLVQQAGYAVTVPNLNSRKPVKVRSMVG